MTISQTITKRLMLARYLFNEAENAARSGREVAAFAAINILQDAIEIFFLATADHLNAEIGRRTEFEQYIDKINERLPEPLPYRQRLIEINKVRVLSKHNGVPPNTTELTGYLVEARRFFEEACQRVFGKSFWTVSLIDLLPDGEKRTFIVEAERHYQAKEYQKCLAECRKVIYEVIERRYVIDAFAHGESLLGQSLCQAPSYAKNKRFIDENVKDPFDYVLLDPDRVDAELVRDGIDPRVFWNIWRLTPDVYRKPYGGEFLIKDDLERYDEATAEQNAAYVLEHTIDILLRMERIGRSHRSMVADTLYVSQPKNGRSLNVYRKADTHSEIVGEVPGTANVSLRYRTPGLEDGYFWRVMYTEDENIVFMGYASEDDLDLD